MLRCWYLWRLLLVTVFALGVPSVLGRKSGKAEVVKEERLPGWLGETHHICYGSKTECFGVDPAGSRRVNRFAAGKTVNSHHLYKYDAKDKSKPSYTHMAMVELLPNNTLIAGWQAGQGNEGTNDQHIVLSHALDTTGTSWSTPQRVDGVGGNGGAVWGPLLFTDSLKRTLWLFYSESGGTCHSFAMDWPPGGDIMAISLNLQTNKWSEPQMIYGQDEDEGIPKVTANKPAELSSGEWLLPFWRERALIDKESEGCAGMRGQGSAGVLRSPDRGLTWDALGDLTLPNSWLIENAVAETTQGDVLMVFRTQIGKIYMARSKDKGGTWSAPEALGGGDLPNPNAKIDMIHIKPSGALALVFNDHAKAQARSKDPHTAELGHKGCKGCRTFLTVALSNDAGKSWTRVALLENEVDTTLRTHYPTVVQQGCDLWVAWSRFYKKPLEPSDAGYSKQGIKLARVPLCASATEPQVDVVGAT